MNRVPATPDACGRAYPPNVVRASGVLFRRSDRWVTVQPGENGRYEGFDYHLRSGRYDRLNWEARR